MAERRPDPKDVRVSMVDKGWSESPPVVKPKESSVPPPPPLPGESPPAPAKKRFGDEITRDESPDISEIEEIDPSTESVPRELPLYEESADPAVTRVDDQIQERVNAMTEEPEDLTTKMTVVTSPTPALAAAAAAPRPAVVVEPFPVTRSSPISSPEPPPPPPPPPLPGARTSPTVRSSPKGASSPTASPSAASPSSPSAPKPPSAPKAPPAPSAPASSAPLPPRNPVVMPSLKEPSPAPAPVAPALSSPSASAPASPFGARPERVLAAKVRTAAWPIPQQPIDESEPPKPPALPIEPEVLKRSAEPTPPPVRLDSTFPVGPSSVTTVDQGPVSTLREALLGRVRVANRPLPLWAVLAPVLVLTAMLAALIVGVLGASSSPSPEASPASSARGESGEALLASTATGAKGRSLTLLERAATGEPAALSSLEKKKPKELGTDEAIALARGKIAQDVAAAKKLRERLGTDPGLAKDKKVIADLLRFAHGRETSQDALATMAALPGPLSADLVYEVWTGTAERSDATELARAILLGKDVRPKASPALGVALDLREATTCEESKALLSKAIEQGDKRALVPINRLARKTGCGPNKRQDCFPCLREGDLIKRAFNAVRVRREPELIR